MRNFPKFITFTGADDNTSIDDMIELRNRYAPMFDVEFGILFSAGRQGKEPRYPSRDFIQRLQERSGDLRLSAHLCGSYSKEIMETSKCPSLEAFLEFPLAGFRRVQINIASHRINTYRAAAFAADHDVELILQTRTNFPKADTIDGVLASWLFDCSGGNGRLPDFWAKYAGDQLVGFAGGMTPDNVREILLGNVDATKNYWTDAETGVRDDHDRFDMAKCWAFADAVWRTPSEQTIAAMKQADEIVDPRFATAEEMFASLDALK